MVFLMKIAVAIVTTGRAGILRDAIADLGRQTCRPDRVLISAADTADIGGAASEAAPMEIEVLIGRKGLTIQRNAVLDALEDEDVVLFLDDDFVMAPDFLARLGALFKVHPDVSVMTGNVLADGIGNAGLTSDQAQRILDRAVAGPRDTTLTEVNNGYGCNMAFRCAPIRAHGLRFDERLPLYGWLEDVDFSRRVAMHGRCVQAMELHGVHLGTKGGRTSGVRLGYSQVANPVYLVGRKTMRRAHALRMICRNLTANLVKSFRPEPWVDRRGRLRGNLAAFGDLMRGRLRPEGVFSMDIGRDGRS